MKKLISIFMFCLLLLACNKTSKYYDETKDITYKGMNVSVIGDSVVIGYRDKAPVYIPIEAKVTFASPTPEFRVRTKKQHIFCNCGEKSIVIFIDPILETAITFEATSAAKATKAEKAWVKNAMREVANMKTYAGFSASHNPTVTEKRKEQAWFLLQGIARAGVESSYELPENFKGIEWCYLWCRNCSDTELDVRAEGARR